ncbi:hypothetical protein PCANC_25701 [Puccinia coronata f. sp. avenae]|uniref:Reverse transcriptase Ty1/copia-type domain-containing protein n=1 Tax=Puccinia coronata f. sp. avenae TaxID=200324 RepID=A0A2N5S3E6_9BASI|nr:hypothetical protein PCANC_25701 [Puccinia coronata f. sp. avenae]
MLSYRGPIGPPPLQPAILALLSHSKSTLPTYPHSTFPSNRALIAVFRLQSMRQALPSNPPPPQLVSPSSPPATTLTDVPATTPTSPPQPPSPPRRSSRVRCPPNRLGNWSKAATTDAPPDTPKTWSQLLKLPNKSPWLKAADEEYGSLVGMSTWKLVPRPAKRKIICSKWVFKVKHRPDNLVQKHKACLVAMGYSQVHGINYSKVFALTMRLETLRLILSLLAVRKWTGRQVDFKTAFLNGRLSDPVYMAQPPGFEDPEHPDWVCDFERSIYGLKQSPREWNLELHAALVEIGLTQSHYDPTLYFCLDGRKLLGALAVHVDDLAAVGEQSFVNSTISSLGSRFKIGADDELHHFLSLKIHRLVDKQLVYLSQEHWIDEMQEHFLPGTDAPVATPTNSAFKDLRRCSASNAPSSGPYQQLLGCLLWSAQCTRPDVSFAVNRLSQFLKDPSESHWQAALRVLWYLVSTKHLRLWLGGSLGCLGFSDSDWAEDQQDHHSTSAYTYRLGVGAISWKSCKQALILLSSTEAEYKAMLDACKEGLWLRHLLRELKLLPSTFIPLHVDNAGAEALAKNPKHHTRTKHIGARFHFIHDCVKITRIQVLHVSTKDMLADMLTKPLPRLLLQSHCLAFGVV